MNDPTMTAPPGLSPEFGIAQITVTTLAAIMMIGLGFLPRPSRATLMWSLAFSLALLSTSLTVTATGLELETLRRASLGVLFSSQVLVWAGLRAWRGAPSMGWVVLPVGAAAALALTSAGDGAGFSVVFRIVFLGIGVFPALTLLELARIPEGGHRMLRPLRVASIAFALIALVSAATIFLFPASGPEDLVLTHSVNWIGLLVNAVCTLVSLLWLAQGATPGRRDVPTRWAHFSTLGADRLTRAREREERSWSLLSIRLDDIPDLRDACGEAGFGELSDSFESCVRRAFPADADIGRRGDGWMVVLAPRTTEVLREQVRELLVTVTALGPAAGATVPLSASVGWASVSAAGYDLSDLLRSADDALGVAAAHGGDRWERVS
ncbi:diguanylate cyclase domain-containing protein [Microbacterium album]|uniref:GGDEF domain-containing protein n=1 Tax=Microbacterium album TaxID=2053191 RepID=A0A917IEY6_9MICO|nr:diguanylate cyclase [Microbacterium album]GGH39817.1 hypothetical protein GCM10010921_11330 [Microbacterium album]